MTQAATADRTYIVHVIDNALRCHEIAVQSSDWRGVKVTARRIAKAQGTTVKYIESIFIA